MARIYAVRFQKVAIAAAQDLCEITPAANKPCRLWGWIFSNVGGTADAGDAQEELLTFTVQRGNTTGGSGGTTVTPPPIYANDPAASFTAKVNNTTLATVGTPVNPFDGGINIRIPDQFFFPPELTPWVTAANTLLVVRLVDAPADSVTCSGTFFVEETP